MKGIITLCEKNTEIFKLKLLCTVNESKTTAETVSTKKLSKVGLCTRKRTGMREIGSDVRRQYTTAMYLESR